MKLKHGTVIINLEKSEEELFTKQIHKNHRWSIKKAIKNKVVFRPGKKQDHKKCYELYQKTCEINYLHPNSNIFDNGFLFVVLLNKKIIGFAIVNTKSKDTISLTYNSSDYEYRNTQANVLLYWKILLYFKKKGYKYFDLGGINIHSKYLKNIDTFKIRWGGEIIKKENKINLIKYIWWRWLRHSKILRKLKYEIQKKLKYKKDL